MISLFVSDIDGCLAEAYRPYDLGGFERLSEAIRVAGQKEGTGGPAFSLCSGRSYPYVEAISQALAIEVPVLFESGGGMFDPVAASVTWHPAFQPEIETAMREIRDWLLADVLPGSQMMFDYGKRTQAGIIGPDPAEVDARMPVVQQHVADHYPGLKVLRTSVSIDVVASGITKLDGLEWLCRRMGYGLEQIAYIGDTHGDIPALEAVGISFAPSNATPDVKEVVHTVTRSPLIRGVLEAYEACLGPVRQS